jgi:hypothetical protein
MDSGTRSEATKELFVTTLVCTKAFGCTPTAASGYLTIRSLLLAVGALTQTLRHNDSLHEHAIVALSGCNQHLAVYSMVLNNASIRLSAMIIIRSGASNTIRVLAPNYSSHVLHMCCSIAPLLHGNGIHSRVATHASHSRAALKRC